MNLNIDYKELSPEQLQEIIANSERELKDKQNKIRMEAISEIKRIAHSINLRVEIHEDDSEEKIKKKVEPKYRNPKDHSVTWSGRGISPIWFREYKGDKNDLLIK